MNRKLAALAFGVLLVVAPAFAKGSHHSSSHKSSSASSSHHKSTSASGTTNPNVVHVHGYTRKDGTYVAPHDRTAPNHTKNDNWSTKGNVNPETGKPGTKPRDKDSKPPLR